MKWLWLLLPLLLLITLPPFPVPQVAAQPEPRSEELRFVIAGDSVLWMLNLTGPQAVLPDLAELEMGWSGVESYEIIASKASVWAPDFEILMRIGLGWKTFRPSGLVLRISGGDAGRVREDVARAMRLGFTPLPGEDAYYSHLVTFNAWFRNRVWPALLEAGGLADLIDLEDFQAANQGFVIIKGVRGAGRFTHQLVVGGFRGNMTLGEEFNLNIILPRLGSVNASDQAASKLVVDVFGALIANATGMVSNDGVGFRARMVQELEPGKMAPAPTIKMVRILPVLLVTRSLSQGIVAPGEEVEVYLKIDYVAPDKGPLIESLLVRDEWWKKRFVLVEGEPEANLTLAPGETKFLFYRLRAQEGAGGQVVTPGGGATYRASVADLVLEETVQSNEAPLLVGGEGALLTITVEPLSRAVSVAGTLPVRLQVLNYGNRAAKGVRVLGPDGGLIRAAEVLPPGERLEFEANYSNPQLEKAKLNLRWRVEWEGGHVGVARSNSLVLLQDYDSPQVPVIEIDKRVEWHQQGGETLLRVGVDVKNRSPRDLTGILLEEFLPEGVELVNSTTLTYDEAASRLYRLIDRINRLSGLNFEYWARLPRTLNLVLPPALAHYQQGPLELVASSTSWAYPLGVRVSRVVETPYGFSGVNVTVRVRVENQGTSPVFTVSLTDNIPTSLLERVSGEASLEAPVLEPGTSVEAVYTARLMEPGNYTAPPPKANIIFSEEGFWLEGEPTPITIFPPVEAMLEVEPPTPMEGQPFTLRLLVKNPSNLTISGLKVALQLPSGLEMLSGTLDIDGASLAGGEEIERSVKAVSRSPLELEVAAPRVEFTYQGVQLEGAGRGIRVVVAEDLTSRYGIPISIGLALVVATALLARRAAFKGGLS